jgi:hypothetical protein
VKTLYEELCRKRDVLAEAEQRATDKGNLTTAWLWCKQRLDLESIIGAMAAHDAGQEYTEEAREEYIAGVLVRCGAAIPVGQLV